MSATLADFLTSPLPSSLLTSHPNTAASPDFTPPIPWSSWWNWATTPEQTATNGSNGMQHRKWVALVNYYAEDNSPRNNTHNNDIPMELCTLIDTIKLLQLPRHLGSTHASFDFNAPGPETHISSSRVESASYGMSPKKSHQVDCMVTLVKELLLGGEHGTVKHVVDVGAGQGYLSRALVDRLNLHVLAIDSNESQIAGSKRWQERDRARRSNRQHIAGTGSISYKTTHIDSTALPGCIDEWIQSSEPTTTQIPVLMVALHACGSLTPSVIRSFVGGDRVEGRMWKAVGMVVVGCCYNLLNESDFPLSKPAPQTPLTLTQNHLQLASQVPSLWVSKEEVGEGARMAVRKVVWRALLEGWRGGEGERRKRLGKLNDGMYKDWDTFIGAASKKMGFEGRNLIMDVEMEGRLEVLHVLRCLLGPVVESLIILDRVEWVRGLYSGPGAREEQEQEQETVRIVNIFDQRCGSPRNVALVISPSPTAI